jgi:hypothetical protein
MPGRIVIHRDDADAHRFNLLDEDGTVLASSKAFPTADEARAGLRRATDLLADAQVIDQEEGGEPVTAAAEVAEPDR